MKSTTVRLTVTDVKRTGYNTNGQPRCKVTYVINPMVNDVAMTKSGAEFLIQGDPRPGEYDIDFNGRGLITDMRKVA
jgi:hypothetical protein